MIRRLFLSTLVALPALAQGGGLWGTWTLVSTPDLAKAIEAAIAPLNPLVRPFARARLARANTPCTTLRIDPDPDGITIQTDQRAPQHVPADGRPMVWTRNDGEKLFISARLDQDDLVQTFRTRDGERTTVFHPDPASHTLTLKVTVTSPRLPNPLVYTLVYH
jgi:hypothetical protein